MKSVKEDIESYFGCGSMSNEEYLEHYGMPRRSGRYPWGSGKDPNQRTGDFLSRVDNLKSQGLSEKEIADSLGMTTTQLRAEKALADACHEAGLEFEIQPGEGAFYGPKLEFKLYDCLGREWQCGTIQADFQLPSAERLDATYIGADNQKHHPVMLHRAILGSFERFLGILIENFAGAFPTWLAFEQVAVVPVSSEFDDYARQVNDALVAHDIRSNAYLDDDNMKNKIKNISMEHRTPYILVVGEKEKADGTVCVRYRFSSKKPQETMKLDDFIKYVEDKVNTHFIGI